MKAPHQLEYRALTFLDALKAGGPPPPSEIPTAHFASWPGPPGKAARLLAAHANAARGRDVLWLVGARPQTPGKLAVPGAALPRFEPWLNELLPFFDGLTPTVRAYTVPMSPVGKAPAKQVVALLIETGRAPFVVRTPGNRVSLEVPWWDESAGHTRPAGRQELIKLLTPLQDLPQFEVLEAELTFYKTVPGAGPSKITHRWTLDGSFYIIPQPETHAVIPLHRCRASVHIPGSAFSAVAQDVSLTADKQSPAVRVTESAVLIEGLGRMFVYCSGATTASDVAWQEPLTLTLDLPPAGAERAAVALATLRPERVTEPNQAGRWKL